MKKQENIEIIQSKEQRNKNKQSLKKQGDIIKSTNLCIMGVPKGENRVPGKRIGEKNKKLPNLVKDMNLHIQKVHHSKQNKFGDPHRDTL